MENPEEIQKFYMAPLQGYTDKVYRGIFDRFIGGIAFYYTPYLVIENSGRIKNLKDIIGLSQAMVSKTIPQLLLRDLDEVDLFLSVPELKMFSKININIGCPYPMVMNKGRGAALLGRPQLVKAMIERIRNDSDFELGIKVRAGIESDSDLFRLMDQIPLDLLYEIIVHPRTAKQLYKGKANIDVYKNLIDSFPSLNLVYNGDIRSLESFEKRKDYFGSESTWMLGRGLLQNPFLVQQITNSTKELPLEYKITLYNFIKALCVAIVEHSNDQGHALNRIRIQLDYMLEYFTDLKKIRKRIKKSKALDDVLRIIEDIPFS